MGIDAAMAAPVASSVSSIICDPNDTPQSLIEAAKGDYESVIAQLMRDKASLYTQNGQLWRLVDRQRTMVLDLQRDFERVSKERDRYHLKSKRYRDEALRTTICSSQSNLSIQSSDATETNVDTNGKNLIESVRNSQFADRDMPPSTDAPSSILELAEIPLVPEYLANNDDIAPKGDSLPNEPTRRQMSPRMTAKHPRPVPLLIPNEQFKQKPNGPPRSTSYACDPEVTKYIPLPYGPPNFNNPSSPPFSFAEDSIKENESSRKIPVDPVPNRNIVSLYSSNTDDEKSSDSATAPAIIPGTEQIMRRPFDSSIPRRPRLPSLRNSSSVSSQLDDTWRGSVEEASRQLSVHIEETHFQPESRKHMESSHPLSNITPVELSPDRLPFLTFKVLSTSGSVKDEAFSIIGVFLRDKELWRVHKTPSQFLQLDEVLQADTEEQLHERALFHGLAPIKIDQRKVLSFNNQPALEAYFTNLTQSKLGSLSGCALCDFLTSNIVRVKLVEHIRAASLGYGKKEGYLTKRGKNFGGWKVRYFVLDGPILRYYESPIGAHLGNIKLPQAQIGRQQAQAYPSKDKNSNDENAYRHAFLVLEAKHDSSNSISRHVLCAESDDERDEWIEALLRYVDVDLPRHHTADKVYKRRRFPKRDYIEKYIDSGDEDGETSQRPLVSKHKKDPERSTPSPTRQFEEPVSPPLKLISGPMNGTPITDKSQWGTSHLLHKDKNKKKSIWGFGHHHKDRMSRTVGSAMSPSLSSYNISGQALPRSVFGVPLPDAIESSRILGRPNLQIPAVLYRCIEFLDAKNAWKEEGIYRLSGSNAVIKSLRDKFNSQGDFDMLNANECFDTHAVAGLLKMYLRELPMSVLSRELHPEFLHVIETPDQTEKLRKIRLLVEDLPPPNLALLKVLCGHLLKVVDNSDENKMTIRNVGIVFSPTLNIPAGVFSLFLTEYDSIFGDPPVR
ncbi:putative Rho-type GTPase-activating protein 2 [Neolecta irregularis DAH-3]|uniref:Putative Rho-type GTPase-activating protein 2 n=1 Tax=Neolecta irregularis (strain DAH-3) TaxID=1198029 RepID=A0A1U7LT05_NEOID|nr:putative Rho-type GTPase-activating protein 2 [Neolecta irregularis DAH-3]|eukprot:OLL25806.1 putative Rho-type GTPase-activating protein 2 [Neolecta irregularis DAH-3]